MLTALLLTISAKLRFENLIYSRSAALNSRVSIFTSTATLFRKVELIMTAVFDYLTDAVFNTSNDNPCPNYRDD